MINIRNPKPHTDGEFSKVLDFFYVYTGDENDSFVQRSCQIHAGWDLELTTWMFNNIKPGWVCLDIGANIGYFTEIMARLVGPSGKVLSFEPIKYLVDKAIQAELLNDYSSSSSIERFPVALSDKDGESHIYIWDSNVGASTVVDGDMPENYLQWGTYNKELIKTNRLESIYTDRVDFIKIDVENHEKLVFDGFGSNARACPLIVAELGNQQPIEFLTELHENYRMSTLSGSIVTVNEIMEHSIINILLEKK